MNDLDDDQPTTAEQLADALPAAPPPRRRRGRGPRREVAAETSAGQTDSSPGADTAPASTAVLAPREEIVEGGDDDGLADVLPLLQPAETASPAVAERERARPHHDQ